MLLPIPSWLPRLLLLTALPLVAVAHPEPGHETATTATAPDHCDAPSLCARLGGPVALDEISGALLDVAVVDPRLAAHWSRVDLKRVRLKLGQYLCVNTGGSCVYENDDMQTIHAGLHVRAAQFYALVEDLREVLDARGVADREKNELLAVLAPTRRDVVQP